MNSEINLSLSEFSIIFDSISIRSKKNKSIYIIWAHTRTARDEESEFKNEARLLYYAHCSQELSYSNTIIINFRKHLKSKYNFNVEEEPNQL
jgi:hypothetical protein